MTKRSVAKDDAEIQARKLRPGDQYGGVVIVRRLSPIEMPIRHQQFRVRCPQCGHEQVLTWAALYTRALRATARCHHCRYGAAMERKRRDLGFQIIDELPIERRPQPWSAERVWALWERANARVAARGRLG